MARGRVPCCPTEGAEERTAHQRRMTEGGKAGEGGGASTNRPPVKCGGSARATQTTVACSPPSPPQTHRPCALAVPLKREAVGPSSGAKTSAGLCFDKCSPRIPRRSTEGLAVRLLPSPRPSGPSAFHRPLLSDVRGPSSPETHAVYPPTPHPGGGAGGCTARSGHPLCQEGTGSGMPLQTLRHPPPGLIDSGVRRGVGVGGVALGRARALACPVPRRCCPQVAVTHGRSSVVMSRSGSSNTSRCSRCTGLSSVRDPQSLTGPHHETKPTPSGGSKPLRTNTNPPRS